MSSPRDTGVTTIRVGTGLQRALELEPGNALVDARGRSLSDISWQSVTEVSGFRALGRTRTLESRASRVRKKLRVTESDRFIVNVWGVGYRLLEGRRHRLVSSAFLELLRGHRMTGCAVRRLPPPRNVIVSWRAQALFRRWT